MFCEKKDVHTTCIKCDLNFCTSCDEKHHSSGKLKDHQRDIYSGLTPSRFCTIKGHEKQPLPIFCQSCSKLICGICVLGEHKAHTCVLAEVAAENAKGILKNAIVPLQETITRAEAVIKTTQEEINALHGEIKKKEEKIKETKKEINENAQKIEEIKSLLNKNQVDSFVLLSMASNLKINSTKVIEENKQGKAQLQLSSLEFKYQSDFDENGLLYYIGTNEKKSVYQNPALSGLIQVTTSSKSMHGTSAIVGRVPAFHYLNTANGSWFAINLIKYKLQPTYYTLRDSNAGGHYQLRNWVLEGSNDGQNYTIIKTHTKDSMISSQGMIGRWPLECKESYRCFRIRVTGFDARGAYYYLFCAGIEFYGLLSIFHY